MAETLCKYDLKWLKDNGFKACPSEQRPNAWSSHGIRLQAFGDLSRPDFWVAEVKDLRHDRVPAAGGTPFLAVFNLATYNARLHDGIFNNREETARFVWNIIHEQFPDSGALMHAAGFKEEPHQSRWVHYGLDCIVCPDGINIGKEDGVVSTWTATPEDGIQNRLGPIGCSVRLGTRTPCAAAHWAIEGLVNFYTPFEGSENLLGQLREIQAKLKRTAVVEEATPEAP